MRIAVAEEGDVVAPRLGRAVKFALFDIERGIGRGAFYRIRHDDPGTTCDHHAELLAVLQDCQAVVARAIGPAMARHLAENGIEPVPTSRAGSAAELAALHAAGTLRGEPRPCPPGP